VEAKHILIGAALLGIAGGTVWAGVDTAGQAHDLIAAARMSPEERERIEHSVYYSRCAEARAAGAAPLYRGQPGYREGLDRDGDGVACEPYNGD
jgi:hypothetical protein